ncbi:MAG: ADP-ribosyltransferase [Sulfobacillus sp.]
MLWYAAINSQLRGIPNGNPQTREMVNYFVGELDHAFSHAPKTEEALLVFRGMITGIPDIGRVVSFPNYLSTSIDPEKALSFAGSPCCLWVIYVPAKTPMIYLGSQEIRPAMLTELLSMSNLPPKNYLPGTEMEMLFPRGTSLRVLSVRENQQLCIYDELEMEPLHDVSTIVEAYLEPLTGDLLKVLTA